MTNDAARAFLAYLLPPESLLLAGNMVDLIFSREGARPFIENWDEVASELGQRILRESVALGDPMPEAIARSGLALQTLAASRAQGRELPERAVLLPIRFRRGDIRLDVFTTVTTLVMPVDVTLQELRVETMFPADEETARQMGNIVSRDGTR